MSSSSSWVNFKYTSTNKLVNGLGNSPVSTSGMYLDTYSGTRERTAGFPAAFNCWKKSCISSLDGAISLVGCGWLLPVGTCSVEVSFYLSVVDLIWDTGKYGTGWNDGGNQVHGREVQDRLSFSLVLISRVKRTAEMWQHTSPRPAMQSWWAQITHPVSSTATQGLKGAPDNLWKWQTRARTRTVGSARWCNTYNLNFVDPAAGCKVVAIQTFVSP